MYVGAWQLQHAMLHAIGSRGVRVGGRVRKTDVKPRLSRGGHHRVDVGQWQRRSCCGEAEMCIGEGGGDSAGGG